MALRRSNDVFLLTLVDFLVQVIFFALFLFVVYQAMLKDPKAQHYDPAQVARAIELAGVSDLKELTDELTNLAPVSLKGFNATLGPDLQQGEIERAAEAIRKAGGAKALDEKLARLEKLERGQGKPSCVYETVNGERRPRLIATAVGTASTITFVDRTPDFDALLASLGLSFERVRSLGLADFRRTFGPVVSRHPDCRYTIVLRETTNLVNARDAAQQIFYVAVRR